MREIKISKKLSKGEIKVLKLLGRIDLYRPPSLRDMADIMKCHHSYVERLRRSLFIKGYLDKFGRPLKQGGR